MPLGFPFSSALSRAEQNLAGELRDIRNRAAHGAPFNFDDTYRALDTAERLLRAADQPAAADRIKAERTDLQRAQIEAETRRDVRESTSISGLGDVELTPWRDVLKPHPDVLSGRFKESEFAANLHSVAHETGTTSAEYSDPVEFFRRTFLTAGLKDLLTQAANRVAGGAAAAPVINLQTTFGGGKTHSMLAVWHLFSVGARSRAAAGDAGDPPLGGPCVTATGRSAGLPSSGTRSPPDKRASATV